MNRELRVFGGRVLKVLALAGCLLTAACGTTGETRQEARLADGAVTLVVPFPTGGIDVIARMMAPELARLIQREVRVVNRPGETGALGSREVSKAEANGRTLLFAPQGPLAYQPELRPVGFDVLTSFVPVCRVTATPSVLMASELSPLQTVRDFVAAAAAVPGGIIYASAGQGGLPHIGMEALARIAGISLRHEAAAGALAAVAALKQGKAQLLAEQLPLATANAGKGVRVIAVFDEQRIESLPGVPTMREVGYDLTLYSWNVILAPQGTPAGIVSRLSAGCGSALTALKADFGAKLGTSPAYLDSAQTAKFLADEVQRARVIVQRSGLAQGKQ